MKKASSQTSVASAPGKVLWVGGYAVLDRPNISFVTGVDKRVYAKAEAAPGGESEFSSPQLEASWTGNINEAEALPPALKFVHLATATALGYLGHNGEGAKGIRIHTFSDPAFGVGGGKSGLGSSAAVTVATVGAVLELYGKPISTNLHLVHKISQYVHCAAQGKVGSGFDVAASCFGASAYSRYSPSIISTLGESPSAGDLANLFDSAWDYAVTPLDLPPGFLTAFGSFVGQSASTSAMVKKVNEWKEKDPDAYRKLVLEIDHQDRVAIQALTRLNRLASEKPEEYAAALQSNGRQVVFTEFKQAFSRGRELTKRLGEAAGAQIESDECTALIKLTEESGGFCSKLPGAGGGDAIAAICLTAAAKRRVQEFWMNYHEVQVEPIALASSNQGVCLDTLENWMHVSDSLGIEA